MKKTRTSFLLLALLSSTAGAATIIDLDFSGVDGSAGGDKSTFELTATDEKDANLNILTGLSFKSPSTVVFSTGGTTSPTNDLNVSGWGSGGSFSAAFNGNRYITITLQAATGFALNLNGATVTFDGFRNGGGAPSEFGITATIGGSPVVIGDQIGSDITVANTGPTNVTPISATFSDPAFDGITDQIEIRLYGAGNSTSGNMHFSDFTIENATVAAIPEPSSTMLLSLAASCLVLRRKR